MAKTDRPKTLCDYWNSGWPAAEAGLVSVVYGTAEVVPYND
jgi:hypothetical protein